MTPFLAVLEFRDYVAIALIVVVFTKAASIFGQRHLETRRLERKVDALLKHQGIADTCGLSEEVRRLARDPGNKIAAIKLHRQETGVGLAEAKADVEAFIESGR
jgi:ribosomal protein L7/L12